MPSTIKNNAHVTGDPEAIRQGDLLVGLRILYLTMTYGILCPVGAVALVTGVGLAPPLPLLVWRVAATAGKVYVVLFCVFWAVSIWYLSRPADDGAERRTRQGLRLCACLSPLLLCGIVMLWLSVESVGHSLWGVGFVFGTAISTVSLTVTVLYRVAGLVNAYRSGLGILLSGVGINVWILWFCTDVIASITGWHDRTTLPGYIIFLIYVMSIALFIYCLGKLKETASKTGRAGRGCPT